LQLSLTDYVPKIFFQGCKLKYFGYNKRINYADENTDN